jgi:glycosyltransferase involved in cell wall biosynthesis
MKILQVHNYYQRPSGEDTVLANEAGLLRSSGHEVVIYSRSNAEIDGGQQALAGARLAARALWSQTDFVDLSMTIRSERPDILHVHNTFPLISPAIYFAASREQVPVVQTLHNYRLTCANGLLMRNGHPCEACVGRLPLAAVWHRCYRDSVVASSVVASMQMLHRTLGTYRQRVHAFIALSLFAKHLMIRAGLPEDRIYVKPNFTDPKPDLAAYRPRAKQIAFVGRLTYEKGVDALLRSWAAINRSDWTLLIIGDGPARDRLQAEFRGLENVSWLGWVNQRMVDLFLRRSAFAVVPSRWYEGFPMAALDAMSVGTPVIAPGFAAFPEVVGRTGAGALFKPGDDLSLQDSLTEAMQMDGKDWAELSANAVGAVSREFGPDRNLAVLLSIYKHATARAKSGER